MNRVLGSLVVWALIFGLPEAVFSAEAKMCPISGEEVSGKHFVEYKGERYDFCCAKCIKEFNKDPEKYIAMMQDEKTSAAEPESHAHHDHAH